MNYDFNMLSNMSIEEVDQRMSELDIEVRDMKSKDDVEDAIEYRDELNRRKEELKDIAERERDAKAITNGTASGSRVIERSKSYGVKHMTSETNNPINEEMRSFQKFLTVGARNMSEMEMRALNLSGAASALPTDIYNKLITGGDYSDLLSRATVINQENAGKLYIPIASNTAATWRTENAAGAEATPTLTNLELGGYELMRLMQMSAASASMTTSEFERLMLELLAAEVVETLEDAFISGDGSGKPTGLDSLSWTTDTNQILTANASTAITAADIAEAASLLPQKYARNSIVIVNADMLYNMSQFVGTSEYAYSMADGATSFLGKPIVVSEHMADDTVYIVDPKQLYVRFAMPIQVEPDKSAGFTSASIYLRALTVVDAAWNPAACVRVGLGA